MMRLDLGYENRDKEKLVGLGGRFSYEYFVGFIVFVFSFSVLLGYYVFLKFRLGLCECKYRWEFSVTCFEGFVSIFVGDDGGYNFDRW